MIELQQSTAPWWSPLDKASLALRSRALRVGAAEDISARGKGGDQGCPGDKRRGRVSGEVRGQNSDP